MLGPPPLRHGGALDDPLRSPSVGRGVQGQPSHKSADARCAKEGGPEGHSGISHHRIRGGHGTGGAPTFGAPRHGAERGVLADRGAPGDPPPSDPPKGREIDETPSPTTSHGELEELAGRTVSQRLIGAVQPCLEEWIDRAWSGLSFDADADWPRLLRQLSVSHRTGAHSAVPPLSGARGHARPHHGRVPGLGP